MSFSGNPKTRAGNFRKKFPEIPEMGRNPGDFLMVLKLT
jgi:hypothetical protein